MGRLVLQGGWEAPPRMAFGRAPGDLSPAGSAGGNCAEGRSGRCKVLRWGCLHVRGTARRRAGQCDPGQSENGGCWPERSATCPFHGRSSHLPQTREPETAASPARSARRWRRAGARAWRFRGRAATQGSPRPTQVPPRSGRLGSAAFLPGARGPGWSNGDGAAGRVPGGRGR